MQPPSGPVAARRFPRRRLPANPYKEVTMRSKKLLTLALTGAGWALFFLLGIDLLTSKTMLESVARFLPGRALLPAARRSP
jgi:hypothetical protein